MGSSASGESNAGSETTGGSSANALFAGGLGLAGDSGLGFSGSCFAPSAGDSGFGSSFAGGSDGASGVPVAPGSAAGLEVVSVPPLSPVAGIVSAGTVSVAPLPADSGATVSGGGATGVGVIVSTGSVSSGNGSLSKFNPGSDSASSTGSVAVPPESPMVSAAGGPSATWTWPPPDIMDMTRKTAAVTNTMPPREAPPMMYAILGIPALATTAFFGDSSALALPLGSFPTGFLPPALFGGRRFPLVLMASAPGTAEMAAVASGRPGMTMESSDRSGFGATLLPTAASAGFSAGFSVGLRLGGVAGDVLAATGADLSGTATDSPSPAAASDAPDRSIATASTSDGNRSPGSAAVNF